VAERYTGDAVDATAAVRSPEDSKVRRKPAVRARATRREAAGGYVAFFSIADTVKRRHSMPFGAELEAGGARFRLWAPAASRVAVRIGRDDVALAHPCLPRGDGWFEAVVDGVRAGDRYAFRIDERLTVPDPASRFNPEGVHAPSVLVDPRAYPWRDAAWRGRPWEETVLYELHVGTFTPEGTFRAAIGRLDRLAALGVTAVELMPLGAFAGTRNWGYDGVLPFAPAACYGAPDDLKAFVDAAHALGLMVLVDVIYNHFGPEGNYLATYAPAFFDAHRQTPWGPAIDFGNRTVRDFFIHNALYWVEEFGADGLRLDAVHAIVDAQTPDIVAEIATAMRAAAGETRHVHLVLENDRNEARRLGSLGGSGAKRRSGAIYVAQWNDDVHHALHVLATGECDGYYGEFADNPIQRLGRALAEGFAWQGEPSPWRHGQPRGEPSAGLPATAFVDFTQTHDQVGNRAFGERLLALASPAAVRAAVACVLLAPAIPMLFMGEDFGASTPFLFFCDFDGELAAAVTAGRREEFGRFARFSDPRTRAEIPDPNAEATFLASKLDWSAASASPGREWAAFYKRLLAVRREDIVPRLPAIAPGGSFEIGEGRLLHVCWRLGEGSRLHLAVNFSATPTTAFVLPGRPLVAAELESPTRWAPYAFACTLETPDEVA
jgi:maltooligosyltrehalose trehalohydrolase